MDREFIYRSLKIAVIITLIFSPFVLLYFGPAIFWGFFAGATWNIVNVFLLSKILSLVLVHSRKERITGIIAAFFKFPVLYGGGYLILKYTNISAYGILCGFSIIFIVFILKTLGMLFVKNNLLLKNNKRMKNYERSS